MYPVVLLKTKEDIESFIDTSKEWIEDTPFYKKNYTGFGELFSYFRKTTRVVAFVHDKEDFKDEFKQLHKAAFELASRDDLRIAKVTNPKLVKEYKKQYNLKWFSNLSSNSMVMFKKDRIRDLIVKYYDLSTETQLFYDWINLNSLESLEELSGTAFKIISDLKKPLFIAFINREHPEYGPESVELYHILQEVAERYPQFIFTFTEEDRYRETKKGKLFHLN